MLKDGGNSSGGLGIGIACVLSFLHSISWTISL
ncbi:MAG: hypothetical protein QOF56_3661, partial [Acidobacteriaceae bacterium]|nr:hypothetical protein [Acidobacteriaceae bacterium]